MSAVTIDIVAARRSKMYVHAVWVKILRTLRPFEVAVLVGLLLFRVEIGTKGEGRSVRPPLLPI